MRWNPRAWPWRMIDGIRYHWLELRSGLWVWWRSVWGGGQHGISED